MITTDRPRPLHGNPHRTSTPRCKASHLGECDPRAADLAWGVAQLDADKDGKVADVDMDMLLELVYPETKIESPPASWKKLKDFAACGDGTLRLCLLQTGLQRGVVQAELREACGGSISQESTSNPRLGPFPSVRDYIRCFKAYDRDCNGVICKEDLKKSVAEQLGLQWSMKDCKEVIRRVDSDGDGVIGLNDFGSLLQALSES